MNKKIFIYAEGREDIPSFMADDMKRAALENGYYFRQLYNIGADDFFDHVEMKKIFPTESCVFLRNLPQNSNGDIAKLAYFLNKNSNITINLNAVGGLEASNDKQFQQFLLASDERTRKYIIPTYEVAGKNAVLALIKSKKLQYPFLLKPRDGSIGKGIRIIRQQTDLDSQKRWRMMLAQNYIESDFDWRVYVIGGVAVGALRRGGKDLKPDDFNAYANGITKEREEDAKVLDEINKIACRMTAVVGLEYGGCDIIKDKKDGKYYILEVNTAATWEGGYNSIIGVDLANKIIEWCEERIKFDKFDIRVRNYIEQRLGLVSQFARDKYKEILDWKWDERIDGRDDLSMRLHDAYMGLKNGKCDNVEIRYLLDEVERMPLCWAGNFIGSNKWGEDGVLEDSIITSACYLAIREKYDKIVGVTKGKL